MSEQASLIPKVPPVKTSDSKAVEAVVPPKDNPSTPSPDESVKATSTNVAVTTEETVKAQDTDVLPSNDGESVVETTGTITDGSKMPDGAADSITPFQGITYASFILTFCLAGIAAVVVLRKASKATVKRFSISAKVLSFAYLVIMFVGFFGTFVYSQYLNGIDTLYPLIIPTLSWIIAGPAIAVALNSLLTREDEPGGKKILFDAFNYLVIFGCVAASQIDSLGTGESLVFSFLGAFFFVFPIIRYSTSLKTAKLFHAELQEMFVQILIRSLLFLPLLLPSLVFVTVCDLISDDLSLLLFNLITFSFVLMTSLLMVISIDYITQGISPDQLVSKKPILSPATAIDSKTKNSVARPEQPAIPVQPSSPAASVTEKVKKAVPEKTVEPKSSGATSALNATDPIVPAKDQISSELTESEESSDMFEFDVEKHDSTVINFDIAKSSTEKSQQSDSETLSRKKSNLRSSSSNSQTGKKVKPPKLPKPTSTSQSPDTDKTSDDSKLRIKPPNKPKKRL